MKIILAGSFGFGCAPLMSSFFHFSSCRRQSDPSFENDSFCTCKKGRMLIKFEGTFYFQSGWKQIVQWCCCCFCKWNKFQIAVTGKLVIWNQDLGFAAMYFLSLSLPVAKGWTNQFLLENQKQEPSSNASFLEGWGGKRMLTQKPLALAMINQDFATRPQTYTNALVFVLLWALGRKGDQTSETERTPKSEVGVPRSRITRPGGWCWGSQAKLTCRYKPAEELWRVVLPKPTKKPPSREGLKRLSG